MHRSYLFPAAQWPVFYEFQIDMVPLTLGDASRSLAEIDAPEDGGARDHSQIPSKMLDPMNLFVSVRIHQS